VELEFGVLVFCVGKETGVPGEKRSEQERTNNKLNPDMTPSQNCGKKALSPLRLHCSLTQLGANN